MDRTPPPPPFRIHEYGPGLEVSNPGKLVRVIDTSGDDQETIGRLRVSARSMRLQTPLARPKGSVRITSSGYSFKGRDGRSICTLSHQGHKVRCNDDVVWVATPRETQVTITDAQNHTEHIPLAPTPLKIETAGKSWSPHATALIYHAYAQPDGDIHTFAAYTLLAWSLRWQDEDHIRKGEH